MADLSRHTVHRALTRPQMFAGVTMNFFIINLMVTTIAFLILKNFWIMLVPIVVHGVGYFASLREPRIFDPLDHEGFDVSARKELQTLGMQQLRAVIGATRIYRP